MRTQTGVSLDRQPCDLQREIVNPLVLQLHYAFQVRDLLLQRGDRVVFLLQLLLQASENVSRDGLVRYLVRI